MGRHGGQQIGYSGLSDNYRQDDLFQAAGSQWMKAASQGGKWSPMGEAYVLQRSYSLYDDDDELSERTINDKNVL